MCGALILVTQKGIHIIRGTSGKSLEIIVSPLLTTLSRIINISPVTIAMHNDLVISTLFPIVPLE